MTELSLRLAEIDLSDVYDFTFPHLSERYDALTERFPGVPLLLVDGKRRVVNGHDYLRLLRLRGETSTNALQAEWTAPDALILNYNILNSLFGLNLCEKLLFVKKILPWHPRQFIQRRVSLPFTLNICLLEKLDLLLAEPFRTCLASGCLGLNAALKLAEMAEEDRQTAIGFFQACKFSESQQARVMQLLEEIAFRDKKPLAALLSVKNLSALWQLEMPQTKILEMLQSARYPAWAQMENDWRKWQKKLAPANGLSLRHAPFFARDEVQLTITLPNRAQAEKLLEKLKKMA